MQAVESALFGSNSWLLSASWSFLFCLAWEGGNGTGRKQAALFNKLGLFADSGNSLGQLFNQLLFQCPFSYCLSFQGLSLPCTCLLLNQSPFSTKYVFICPTPVPYACLDDIS